ncbi:alpha-pore-forming tripartite toxin MakABE regulator [Pseudomonas viridiflava]|uniref:alpha-pore-forming tripartite toxin MakABE regulator n=1 Tax=Pseudomonas viridiflava TaxID=33069 RepID=UPI000F0171AD|nr:hypothetical protein [Pseudomonas viridiflava]
MNRVDILIAVDVLGALSAGTLQGNVYLMDTNHYLGSWQEGQGALNTVCQDGQAVTWSVTPVDAATQIAISKLSGPMVDGKVCMPTEDPFAGNSIWNGIIETQGAFANYAYTVSVVMNAVTMTFESNVKVV